MLLGSIEPLLRPQNRCAQMPQSPALLQEQKLCQVTTRPLTQRVSDCRHWENVDKFLGSQGGMERF